MQNQFQDLNNRVLNCTDQNGINLYLADFNDIFSNVCSPFFKSSKVNNSYKYDEKHENPWFNEDCEEKRHVFLQKLNLFRTLKNDKSRITMTRARSEYKRTIRCARYEFDRQKTLRFEQAKFVNAKLYWKMLKESANVKSSSTVNLFITDRSKAELLLWFTFI